MPVSERTGTKGLSPAITRAFRGAQLEAFTRQNARLAQAGYGAVVARAFAAAAPRVAADVGPDQAVALGRDASLMAIRARPRVATAYLDICPDIAAKLMDAEAFARWRAMIAALLKSCPQAVEPLVTRSVMLLDRLGLTALCALAQTGIRLANGDEQLAIGFFRLETPEARRLLARHAGEVTFADLKTGLDVFHTALWGCAPVLQEVTPRAVGGPVRRTSFTGGIVLMPSAFAGFRGRERQLYRASLAHVGAHAAHGGAPFPVGELKPLQIAVISLLEDARVETLAARDMPGLLRLWAPFHVAQPDGLATAPNLFAMLARALIDPGFAPAHGWVRKGARMFQQARARLHEPAISREIGNLLGNDLGQLRVQFDPLTHVVEPAYRDDNLGIWDLPDHPDAPPPEQDLDIDIAEARRPVESDPAPDRRDTAPPQQKTETVRAVAANPDAGRVLCHVPEHDVHAGLDRDAWVQVNAYDPLPGDAGFWDGLTDRHGATIARLTGAVAAQEAGKRRRLRRQAEGEALDLDAALDAAVATRAGRQPDPNVYACLLPPERSIAVHLMLDVSRSTADPAGPGLTILDTQRDAAAILARTIEQLGDALAITAFCSAGRHDLRVTPIKDFDAPLTRATGAALSGLRPNYSTRIGAALRFAARGLEDVSRYRKLVLLVTDGEPSDIDVSDPEYLVADARRAVHTMRARGIDAICVAVGPEAGQRQTEIFGRKSCVQIADAATLPARLSAFYLGASR